MEWLEPRGGTFVVNDCVEPRENAVRCHVAYEDPLHDALGLDGTTVGFTVRDGLVARLALPNYGSADIALRGFVLATDPEGFDAVCADPGDGCALTAECGRLLADHVPGLIASLE
jgi:hypothetical protein